MLPNVNERVLSLALIAVDVVLALPIVPVMSVVASSTRCHPLSLTAKSLRFWGLLPCNTVTKSSITNPAGNESMDVHAVFNIS